MIKPGGVDANTIDLEQAPRYRKKACVLAFFMEDGATYGERSTQEFPGPHFVLVGAAHSTPEVAGGRVIATNHVTACTVGEFEAMYAATDTRHVYRAVADVRAARLGQVLAVESGPQDGNVDAGVVRRELGDWLVLQPNGECQQIAADLFHELYEPVPGD